MGTTRVSDRPQRTLLHDGTPVLEWCVSRVLSSGLEYGVTDGTEVGSRVSEGDQDVNINCVTQSPYTGDTLTHPSPPKLGYRLGSRRDPTFFFFSL